MKGILFFEKILKNIGKKKWKLKNFEKYWKIILSKILPVFFFEICKITK